MNGLDRYASLVEPITGERYSASGGYGPAGVFTSPLADYYSAFAPSAYVNRALIDGSQNTAAMPTGEVLATLGPLNTTYSTRAPRERVAMTARDINDYYNVIQQLSGQEEPSWPEAIMIQPRSSQEVIDGRRAAGLYTPDEQRIDLYSRTWDAGYINPDLGYLDYYASRRGEDRVLPHELAHFYDRQYVTNPQYLALQETRSAQPSMPKIVTEESPRGSINTAVLLNQLPRVTYDPRINAVTSPMVLGRPAEAGYVPTGASESELYADQLGTALRLWKNAGIDKEPYNVAPVVAEEIDKYNFVARMSPYIGLINRIMSGQEVTPKQVESANKAARQADKSLSKGVSQDKQASSGRQEEIARALLMEMALSRLSQSPNLVSVADPTTGQFLPVIPNAE